MLDYDCQNASKLGVPMSIRLMEEIRAGEIIIVVEVKCSRHMGDIRAVGEIIIVVEAAAVDGRDKSCW